MKTTKEVIISLIKDDLTNLKLIKGLNKLGLDAEHYDLNLPDSIIKLMNNNLTNDENEMIHEYYCEISNRIIEYELTNISDEMKAGEIFKEIENKILNFRNG